MTSFAFFFNYLRLSRKLFNIKVVDTSFQILHLLIARPAYVILNNSFMFEILNISELNQKIVLSTCSILSTYAETPCRYFSYMLFNIYFCVIRLNIFLGDGGKQSFVFFYHVKEVRN